MHVDGAHGASALLSARHRSLLDGIDFIHRTVECTKAGLCLRFFAVLASLGDFECPARPDANMLCFRLRNRGDAAHLSIRDALIADGSFHLSMAEVGGRRFLRCAFMNPDTSMEDVRALIERVRRAAAENPA